jgi:hypothetical protein
MHLKHYSEKKLQGGVHFVPMLGDDEDLLDY